MSSLKLAQSALRKLMKVLCVVCVMRSQVMNRTIGKSSEPNAYSVRLSMFIAKLELARLMAGELLQDSVTLVLAFLLKTT